MVIKKIKWTVKLCVEFKYFRLKWELHSEVEYKSLLIMAEKRILSDRDGVGMNVALCGDIMFIQGHQLSIFY